MKERFFPYFKYNEDIIKDLWERGKVVIDTNALLNTYKMNEDARKQFFEVLAHKELSGKLWMPHQIGWEFLKNRKEAINESLDAIKNIKNDIQKQLDVLNVTITKSGLRFHEELLSQVQEDLKNFKKSMKDTIVAYDEENKRKRSDFYDGNQLKETDSIIDEMNQIYDGKYAERFPHDELIGLYNRGEFRFSLDMPPGFKDKVKGDYRKFGDFLIWEEMIKNAKENAVPIIFVTEDHKRDWWLHDEKTQKKSPLPELLMEFKDRTSEYFYMYSYKEFIDEAKTRYSDLPETGEVTKQMDFATEESELRREDPYNILLQNQMNSGNSAVANNAYRKYIGTPLGFDAAYSHALNIVQQLYDYNTGKALSFKREIDEITSSGIKEYKMENALLKLIPLIELEIDASRYVD